MFYVDSSDLIAQIVEEMDVEPASAIGILRTFVDDWCAEAEQDK
jgi:hypothetical protein